MSQSLPGTHPWIARRFTPEQGSQARPGTGFPGRRGDRLRDGRDLRHHDLRRFRREDPEDLRHGGLCPRKDERIIQKRDGCPGKIASSRLEPEPRVEPAFAPPENRQGDRQRTDDLIGSPRLRACRRARWHAVYLWRGVARDETRSGLRLVHFCWDRPRSSAPRSSSTRERPCSCRTSRRTPVRSWKAPSTTTRRTRRPTCTSASSTSSSATRRKAIDILKRGLDVATSYKDLFYYNMGNDFFSGKDFASPRRCTRAPSTANKNLSRELPEQGEHPPAAAELRRRPGRLHAVSPARAAGPAAPEHREGDGSPPAGAG